MTSVVYSPHGEDLMGTKLADIVEAQTITLSDLSGKQLVRCGTRAEIRYRGFQSTVHYQQRRIPDGGRSAL